jgi:NAD(P)-dependent dehydrogenase (short-subunit alcohol dehydrogenase family)
MLERIAVTDMIGKVCIVTGSSSGIGKETAAELAGMGATVIMLVRNRERGESAMQEILRRFPDAKLELLVADLSIVNEIRRAAAEFKTRHERLDVLVNNAGGVSGKRTLTPDGLEMTFAVNYLAPFLLTHELLDVLVASAPSRIVNVSSTAHNMGRVDLDDLQSERRYGALRTYGSAKLMNIMFTYELARRLDSSGVAVNVLHPGFVATNFGRDSNRAIRFFYRIARPFERNSHEGAKTSVYLASSTEVEGVSGKYFYDSKPKESSSASYDIERQKQLWLATESILAGLGVGLRKQEYSVAP